MLYISLPLGLAGEDFPLVELRSRSDNELGKGPVDPGVRCLAFNAQNQTALLWMIQSCSTP